MRRILSICNFSHPYSAILIAVFLIGGIEIIFSALLPAKLFSHEVDKILYEIKTEPKKADYILLGDSVGRQILKEYERNKNFSMLATNQAIEMTGQYFLIKRFLKNNPPPKAVVFAGLPFFLKDNLEKPFTENYILRTFNDFYEVVELLKVKKNLTQTVKSISYKLFTSFKYRLHLQKFILGSTNANIYSGVGEKATNPAQKNYSFGDIIKKYQGQQVSLYHFRKLIELLTIRGIHFYYIPVPVKQKKDTKNPATKHYNDLFKVLTSWKNEGMNISFYDNIIEYPEHMFSDHVHFNNEGLIKVKPYIDDNIKEFIINFNQKNSCVRLEN